MVVQEGVDLAAKLEEAAVVAGDGCLREGQGRGDGPVVLLRVVPDDEGMVLDLLGDQIPQSIRDQTIRNLRLLFHVRLSSSVSVFWASAIGLSSVVKGAKSDDSKSDKYGSYLYRRFRR